MADLLEWRQRLESTHKQLLDAMRELITNKNYSEAERILYVVDKLMLDLIEDMGGTVVRCTVARGSPTRPRSLPRPKWQRATSGRMPISKAKVVEVA